MARRSIQVNGENCSLAELEVAMRAARSRRAYDRMRAIRALALGKDFQDVADYAGVSRRTLQRWVERFDAQGIDGLIDRPRSGAPRKIAAEHTEHLRQIVREPSQAGQTHWTARKFHGYLREELQCEVGYRTVVRWLHEHNFRLKVPQPWPDRQDEALRQAFVEQSAHWLADEQIDLWYADEMGVEGDPRPRRRWAAKGEKTRVVKNGDHLRMNVTGAICPRSGQFYALEFSHSDTESFQVFLDQANAEVPFERPRNLLILDNASWHKAKSLRWGRFEPVFLPPYSPDLNPIERLWLLIKAQWFYDYVAKDREALIQRLDQALCWAMDRQSANTLTCSIKTKL